MTSEFRRAIETAIKVLYPIGVNESFNINGQIIVPPMIWNEAQLVVKTIIEALKDPTEKTMDSFRAAASEEWNNALEHILNGSD